MSEKVVRSFLPVGHGAFTVENIDGRHYLFDCGSLRSPAAAESRVNHYLFPDMAIEAVFISQMRGEYINGLERLLEWCRVKRLFLPLPPGAKPAPPKERARIFERELLADPEGTVGYISPHTKVVRVAEWPDGPAIPLERAPAENPGPELAAGAALTAVQNPDWIFLPCNMPDRGPGLNRMAVYSGPSHSDARRRGALYLGGCDAADRNWTRIGLCYDRFFENVGVLTVPQHGSVSCFNGHIAELECDKIITAHTAAPPWRDHPHGQVILTLKRGQGRFYICSLKNGKKYTYQTGRRKTVKDLRFLRKEL